MDRCPWSIVESSSRLLAEVLKPLSGLYLRIGAGARVENLKV